MAIETVSVLPTWDDFYSLSVYKKLSVISLVDDFLSQVVQLCAGFVKVHVHVHVHIHHSSRWVLVEVGCNLVKSLATSLRHPEKGEDEEEEEERGEYQEDVGPTEVLRSNAGRFTGDWAFVSTASHAGLVTFSYSQQHIGNPCRWWSWQSSWNNLRQPWQPVWDPARRAQPQRTRGWDLVPPQRRPRSQRWPACWCNSSTVHFPVRLQTREGQMVVGSQRRLFSDSTSWRSVCWTDQ